MWPLCRQCMMRLSLAHELEDLSIEVLGEAVTRLEG